MTLKVETVHSSVMLVSTYRVIEEERSIFWEVTVSVIVRGKKKFI
jgi:hypothetical protein